MRGAAKARRLWVVLSALCALVSAGCTTVPKAADPEIVRPIDNSTPTQPPSSCPHNAIARAVVLYVLQQTILPDSQAAEDCMTQSARHDLAASQKITIIDNPTVSNLGNGAVAVVGTEMGTIGDNGAYTPSLSGDGSGTDGTSYPVSYGMKRIHGQWRINSISPRGAVITNEQFASYQQRDLYFFDLSEQHLVPVPLYTEISSPEGLVRWLVSGLAVGPGDDQALTSSLPTQTDPTRVRVTFDHPDLAEAGALPVTVDIPGASQLGPLAREQLAAQLSQTLVQADVTRIGITDRGAPVPVDSAPTFAPQNILDGKAARYLPISTSGALYFMNNGALYQGVSSTSQPVPGAVGAGAYPNLTSVAVTLPQGTSRLSLAGVGGDGPHKYLDIGTQYRLVRVRGVSGDLSRPAWSPSGDDVWVGKGRSLVCVNVHTHKAQSVQMDFGDAVHEPDIVAVRISPEGARIALVLSTTPASSTSPKSLTSTSQIWVGTIVRVGNRLRVSGLNAISPQGVHVTDVAWYDANNLFAIGTYVASGLDGVFEVQVDGSAWTFHEPTNLPPHPDSLTVAANATPVVSVGDSLWRQDGSGWVGLLGEYTSGTNPVYIE